MLGVRVVRVVYEASTKRVLQTNNKTLETPKQILILIAWYRFSNAILVGGKRSAQLVIDDVDCDDRL